MEPRSLGFATYLQDRKFVHATRNVDFCEMTTTWEFVQNTTEDSNLYFTLKHDDLHHVMGFGSPSRVQEHLIMDKKLVDKKGRHVLWDRPFHVVPEPFLGSHPDNIKLDTKVLLDDGIYLVYKGKNRQHLFQSVYLKAKEIAATRKHAVFYWWHSQVLYVLAFKQEQLQLANSYSVTGVKEVLYFILSVTQECGFHDEEFLLMGDSSEENQQLLEGELEKLNLSSDAMSRKTLYAGYSEAPFGHLSTFLSQLPQCALPEEY